MLAMDPQVDTYDETRQLATQFVVFIVIIVLTVFATRYFDEHGGPAAVRKWLSEACGPANKEDADETRGADEEGYQSQPETATSKPAKAEPAAEKQTPIETASEQAEPSTTGSQSKEQPPRDLASIPASSPLFVLLGLAASFPLAAVTLTYPLCALLFPGAGPFLLSCFPIFLALSQLAACLLLSSPLAAPLSLHRRILSAFLFAAALLMLLPLSSFDLEASGVDPLLLLLTCLGVGGFTGLCRSSLLSLAALMSAARSPEAAQDAEQSERSTSTSKKSNGGGGGFIYALLCGQGAANVLTAVTWVAIKAAETRKQRAHRLLHPADPAVAADMNARMLSGGAALLAVTSIVCALGGYIAYRISARTVTAKEHVLQPAGVLGRRSLSPALVALKPACTALCLNALASTLLFPGLLESQESESGAGHGRELPEYLSTELILVHTVCDLAGRLLAPAFLSLLRASPSFSSPSAKLEPNRWLALAALRGAGISVAVLVLLAFGWRDNALLAVMLATVGASNGLLSVAFVLQGMDALQAAPQEEQEQEEGEPDRKSVV